VYKSVKRSGRLAARGPVRRGTHAERAMRVQFYRYAYVKSGVSGLVVDCFVLFVIIQQCLLEVPVLHVGLLVLMGLIICLVG
jgi:hypothetical protein